ncbi:hypothetical protein N9X24_00570 [Rickettsiales bacterium]|nr:hypothetical protein [Rickettsiales bacterium]
MPEEINRVKEIIAAELEQNPKITLRKVAVVLKQSDAFEEHCAGKQEDIKKGLQSIFSGRYWEEDIERVSQIIAYNNKKYKYNALSVTEDTEQFANDLEVDIATDLKNNKKTEVLNKLQYIYQKDGSGNYIMGEKQRRRVVERVNTKYHKSEIEKSILDEDKFNKEFGADKLVGSFGGKTGDLSHDIESYKNLGYSEFSSNFNAHVQRAGRGLQNVVPSLITIPLNLILGTFEGAYNTGTSIKKLSNNHQTDTVGANIGRDLGNYVYNMGPSAIDKVSVEITGHSVDSASPLNTISRKTGMLVGGVATAAVAVPLVVVPGTILKALTFAGKRVMGGVKNIYRDSKHERRSKIASFTTPEGRKGALTEAGLLDSTKTPEMLINPRSHDKAYEGFGIDFNTKIDEVGTNQGITVRYFGQNVTGMGKNGSYNITKIGEHDVTTQEQVKTFIESQICKGCEINDNTLSQALAKLLFHQKGKNELQVKIDGSTGVITLNKSTFIKKQEGIFQDVKDQEFNKEPYKFAELLELHEKYPFGLGKTHIKSYEGFGISYVLNNDTISQNNGLRVDYVNYDDKKNFLIKEGDVITSIKVGEKTYNLSTEEFRNKVIEDLKKDKRVRDISDAVQKLIRDSDKAEFTIRREVNGTEEIRTVCLKKRIFTKDNTGKFKDQGLAPSSSPKSPRGETVMRPGATTTTTKEQSSASL